MSRNNIVYVHNNCNYNHPLDEIIDNEIFDCIQKGDTVLLKPNWVKESHLKRLEEWEYVITHPSVLTAVLKIVIKRLNGNGKIIIADGPQTDSSWEKIIGHYPVESWMQLSANAGIDLQIIDLREDEWINEGDITVERKKLPGDPLGSTEVNLLEELSEFWKHNKSKRGYYGADYNLRETNLAHDGKNNLYRISKTVISADVFVNMPKLKTHKKAGITSCLKNLVGINTYKNYLPHYTEGIPSDYGDQFPIGSMKANFEGSVMAFFKQHLLQNVDVAKSFKPVKKMGTKIFGKTDHTIRSGNWYGNDTIWRMILDLNKILFYANPNGSLREDDWSNSKKYIGIVDGIMAGEGDGPMSPDPVSLGVLICGTNPVAIDSVCANLMGFDPLKIPSIQKAYCMKNYEICNFNYNDILVYEDKCIKSMNELASAKCFKPHFGWINQIEK